MNIKDYIFTEGRYVKIINEEKLSVYGTDVFIKSGSVGVICGLNIRFRHHCFKNYSTQYLWTTPDFVYVHNTHIKTNNIRLI